MTDSIRDIILALPPMTIGEQVNVYHCKEGRGNDRLYIKRTNHGWLFNCFHCGESGGIRQSLDEVGTGRAVRSPAAVPLAGKANPKYLPRDVTREWAEFIPQARAWLGKYLTLGEVNEHGICYSPSLKRVVLPCYVDGTMVGYQTRRLLDSDTGPKYLTYTTDSSSLWLHLHSKPASSAVVLVEDQLSAIKCARHLSSAALYGVSIKDGLLARLVREHSKFLIFLDNDNLLVRAAARKMARRLDIFGEARIIEGVGADPKELDDTTLKGLLT